MLGNKIETEKNKRSLIRKKFTSECNEMIKNFFKIQCENVIFNLNLDFI